MPYSLDALSDNCYAGTAVLINKLNIRDEAELEKIEAEFVSARSVQWEIAPRVDTFSFAHYKAVNRFLFGDLYAWAGQARKVNISKKGTNFCPANQIKSRAGQIFARLKRKNLFKDLAMPEYIAEIVDFYCATNDLHPFREGNGRTQRVFLTQLIRHAGHDIDFSEMDGDLLMIATIQAAGGVTQPLGELFTESIRE